LSAFYPCGANATTLDQPAASSHLCVSVFEARSVSSVPSVPPHEEIG
jgi:hypothetical protein